MRKNAKNIKCKKYFSSRCSNIINKKKLFFEGVGFFYIMEDILIK
jgi:hypothetical protein